MKQYGLILILLLTTFSLFGCGDSNPDAPGENQAHPAVWVQVHPVAAQASANYDSCRVCHGVNLTGASTADSCYSCHFDPDGSQTPPGTNWTHATDSHANLSSTEEICNTCHSLLRDAGNGPAVCHDCHGSATPHPIGEPWLNSANTGFHGDAALQANADCTICHGLDYSGGLSGIGCDACHFGPEGSKVPAGSSWAHGSTPHADLKTDEQTCNACHTLLRGFGGGPNSCHDCHSEVASHPAGEPWINPVNAGFHGNVVDTSCTQCHGIDFSGGGSGVSCDQCHFGPSGSRVPIGVNWVHGDLSHENQALYRTTCVTCHDLLKGYNGSPNCHNCH